MKKFIISIFAAICFAATSNAEVLIGVSGAITGVDTTGTETLKSSSNQTSTSEQATTGVPSIFIEFVNDAGVGIGLDYIPADFEIGARSVTKTDTDVDDSSDTSGTNKASAEISNHLTAYVSVPVADTGAYVKLGYVQVTINTTESLATGTSYGNADINGWTGGLGFGKKFDNNAVVRIEGTYTDYDEINITGSADADSVSNTIRAEPEAYALRLSLAYAF